MKGDGQGRLARALRGQVFLLVAATVAAAAVGAGIVPWRDVPRIEDGRLLATLASLILSVEVLRSSGALDALVRRTIARFSRARSLTFALVLASGVLSSVVTNDVALFVVIPVTVAAARLSDFRVRNAVILEITAANVLGCMTPIGNPQNLFLFHRSGMSIPGFLGTMFPFGVVSAALLGVAVLALEPARPITRVDSEIPPLEPYLAAWGAAGIGLVLAAIAGWLPPWLPLAVIVPAALPLARRGASAGSLAIVPSSFSSSSTWRRPRLDFDGLCSPFRFPRGHASSRPDFSFSQAISNVPAAVLLAPFAEGAGGRSLRGQCGWLRDPDRVARELLGWQIYLRERGPDSVYLPRFLR
jgi:di/tricarboxylate transporter